MSRADSPLRDRMIFAFGARRSGTWWLQRILTGHPDVAEVPSETYLFELGIRPLLERFHHGPKASATVAQMHADREQLLDATRDFCDRMLLPYTTPDARFLSERSPGHAKALDVIGAVYPDARQIHIIRDGRDVARSLAAREWGPAGVGEAARDWREHVEAARANAGRRYLEVRYEELLDGLEGGIRRLYGWLGLEADDALVADVAVQARRPLNQDPKDPRVATGKWRDHFGREELAAFQAEAGGLLAQLGYEEATPAPPPAPAPRRTPGRFIRGGLARARRPQAASAAPGWEVGGHLAVVQRLADELMEKLHSGDRAGVAALLHADVTLRIVDDAGEQTFSEPGAAADALVADDAWRRPQLRGDPHPGTPRFSLAMEYEGDGSGPEWRILYLAPRDERIGVLHVYRIGPAR